MDAGLVADLFALRIHALIPQAQSVYAIPAPNGRFGVSVKMPDGRRTALLANDATNASGAAEVLRRWIEE